jgi:hypothetical protein
VAKAGDFSERLAAPLKRALPILDSDLQLEKLHWLAFLPRSW